MLAPSEFEKARIDLVWRLGGRQITYSHVMQDLIPVKQYRREHPEYFGTDLRAQACQTHPDVIRIIADKYRRQLDEQTEGIVSFSLSSIDDAYYSRFCHCRTCTAVGNLGARKVNFANLIARDLARSHPHRFLLNTLATWNEHPHPDPMIKAEPGGCVMLVNEGDHVHPWDEPEPEAFVRSSGRNNTREINAFNGWQKTAAIMAMYEWWIPGPRPE